MKILKFSLGSMQTNCYLVYDEETKECLVIDPADECGAIERRLNEHELKLKTIVLTHVHFDHMLALEELRKDTGAPLAVGEEDAPALLNPDLSMMRTFAGVNFPCKPAEILLREGDTLTVGKSELKVLHTPGHTLGSLCLLTDDILISGDTLFLETIGRHDFYGGDYASLLASLKRLTAIEGDRKVYPGHGACTTLSHEREYNVFLQQ